VRRDPLGIVLVIAAVAGLVLAIRRGSPLDGAVRQWLVVGGIALALALVCLVPLLPAEHALTPGNEGFGNRLMTTSSLFIPLLYVSAIALAALGLAELIRRPRWALPVAAVAFVTLAAQMIHRELQRQDDFSAAWDEEQRIVDRIQNTLPAPKPNSVIVSFRHPLVLDGGLVSFATDYDLDGALKLRYGDSTIRAHAYLPGTTRCGPTGVTFSGTFEPSNTLPYGQMYFVDVAGERATPIASQAQCTSELARLTSRQAKKPSKS